MRKPRIWTNSPVRGSRPNSISSGKRPLEGEELHGPALELALKALVGLEYRHGARAELAVVQEPDGWVEEKLLLHHS